MKTIVFRVRKQYFDAIEKGDKPVEYRKDAPYWRKTLIGLRTITGADQKKHIMMTDCAHYPEKKKKTCPWGPEEQYCDRCNNYTLDLAGLFICGKRTHKRRITDVDRIPTPVDFSAQGKKDVDTDYCFRIHLGEILNVAT